MGAVAREQFVPDARAAARLCRPRRCRSATAASCRAGRARPAADADDAASRRSARSWSARAPAIRPRCSPRSGSRSTALESSPSWPPRPREHGIDGRRGPARGRHRKGAPYDLILIDGAVEYHSRRARRSARRRRAPRRGALDRGITRLVVGRKAGGAFGYLSVADAGVPVLPGFARPQAFTF